VSWKNAAQGKPAAQPTSAMSPEEFAAKVNAMPDLSAEDKQKGIDAYNKAYQFNQRREAARPPALPGTAPTKGKGKPLPKTADGKIDGSKLEVGEMYVDSQGISKIWNGTSFQPVQQQ
jgi:hypothetical protein